MGHSNELGSSLNLNVTNWNQTMRKNTSNLSFLEGPTMDKKSNFGREKEQAHKYGYVSGNNDACTI